MAWMNLVATVANVQLTNDNDVFIWDLQQRGQFAVKSMYKASIASQVSITNRMLWKLKIPLEVFVVLA